VHQNDQLNLIEDQELEVSISKIKHKIQFAKKDILPY
jgi:hypothetical protein